MCSLGMRQGAIPRGVRLSAPKDCESHDNKSPRLTTTVISIKSGLLIRIAFRLERHTVDEDDHRNSSPMVNCSIYPWLGQGRIHETNGEFGFW